MTIDLSTLNTAQRDGVLFTEGPVLIIAGPGAGKTATLTRRIARLVEEGFAHPSEILAITFTNKAAGEMKERLQGMLGDAARGIWACTFHSLGVRLLRRDAERLGWTRNFTIYDADDAKRLIKRLMKDAGYEEGYAKPSAVASIISKAKTNLTVPSDFGGGPAERVAVELWDAYAHALKAANAYDFDDLLGMTHLLLSEFPEVRKGYQDRFRYIHIDEFQDTSQVQEEIARMLAGKRRNIMAVGDDGQSIYAFRSAKIEYILGFQERWPEAITIKLERNYRSTGHIVRAVNALIANNETGMPKDLYTELPDGHKVLGMVANDDRDEAWKVVRELERLMREERLAYSDFAVFYRTNAQSRQIEDSFLKAGVPYKIVGGTRYFDRAEVRDLMAYLKVLVNPADGISLRRIVNVPRRGIGDTSLNKLDAWARERGWTLWQAMEETALGMGPLPKRATEAIYEFTRLLDGMRKAAMPGEGQVDVAVAVQAIIEKTGMVEAYEALGDNESLGRAENVAEFLNVAIEFGSSHPNATLADFVEWLALRTDLDEVEEGASHAVLMTVHTAKGLEFPCVFVTGLEEEVFPHINSINEGAAQLEEERRLAYVALSRAERHLVLLRARQRMSFGQIRYNKPSRFLAEIPPECLEAEEGFAGGREAPASVFGGGARSGASRGWRGGTPRQGTGTGSSLPRPAAAPKPAAKPAEHWAKGTRVRHKAFGLGTVTVAGTDSVEVRFDDGSRKKLMPAYAPMGRIS